MKKSRLHLVLLISGVFLITGSLLFNSLKRKTLQEISAEAGLKIEEKIRTCDAAIDSVRLRLLTGITEPDRFFEQARIAVYVYKRGKLTYWNNSALALGESLVVHPENKGSLKKLNYGYYIYTHLKKDSLDFVALCLLKPQYALQNNYLSNAFQPWTGIPKDLEISDKIDGGTNVIVNGNPWFSIKGSESYYYYSERADHLSLLVFVLGFITVLLALLALQRKGIKTTRYLLMVLLLVLARSLMLYFKWPAFAYRTALYDVRLFGDAQSFVNGYLGDILLNALLLLFMSASLYFYRNKKDVSHWIFRLLSGLMIFLAFNQYNQTLVSVVTNSTLNFDFTDVLNIKIPAVFAVLALCFYSLALLISMVGLLGSLSRERWTFAWFAAITLSICLLQFFMFPPSNYFQVYWMALAAFVVYACYQLPGAGTSLILGVQVIMLSLVTSLFLNYYINKNQNQDLDILSLKLSEKTDAILESEYAGIPTRLARDESFMNLVNFLPDSREAVEQSLKQKFFAGYFDRYDVEFSLFDSNCKPLLETKQAILLNEGFFEDKIRFYSDSVMPGLYFVNDERKSSQYIGKIKLKSYNLYVLMEPKQFEELGSFPDLLLDQSLQKQDKLKSFSYAVYHGQQSANRYGKFNYPFFLQDSLTLSKTNQDYTHFYFKADPGTDIVISKRSRTWNYFFTFNSYLLLFFSLVTYGCYLIYVRVFTSLFRSSSLTRRIQTIIVFLLLLAMSGVGITSGKLVIRQFETDNKQQLHEKTDIIIAELNNQYTSSQLFDESQKELLNLRIKEYARLFNTPISLFSKSGTLFNTSEPKLYDLGLAPKLMNARAFYSLSNNRLSSISVNERAGTLKYVSYYTPIFDKSTQLVGFINLPYFARQSDLTDELSGIISALINVYVILFVLSIVAGLILASYITRPLQLIKQQFSKITLGKQNEKLHWPANDEIGKLVFEYNQMLNKLEESANLLARSEREGAWREMAKQVAHEIKNPLTPMKLNLQYLQHLMKNNPDDFRDKFEKASSGIIEQIDSLANIATEFSNFAKLPGTQLQTINLVEVINASVRTFENQKNVDIRNLMPAAAVLISGDKDQCLRVFNNILKNAVQAVEEVPQPLIEIACRNEEDWIVVSIRDNGCGIDEELKSRMFTPNFTTKSTGSGLGLAMVKNIMQGFGGDIRFESQKGSGTVFFLEFRPAGAHIET